MKGGADRWLQELLRQVDGMLLSGQPPGQAIRMLERARASRWTPIQRYGIGEALLRASNGRLGWDLYDLHPSRPEDRLAGFPRWDGAHCELFIVLAEQGFGDAIQFLRYVPQIIERADAVLFAIHDPLFDVVAGSPLLRGARVMPKSEARRSKWPATARWERLMSLPARLPDVRVSPAAPYLRIPMTELTLRLSVSARPITVGVAWRSTRRQGFANRSFPSRVLGELTRSPHNRVVCLHRDRDVRTAPPGVEMVGIRNLRDTAEVISQCDYVVTADTVTAHLAPAVGVPTLICLRHRPDWRWGTRANPTQWYASAKTLFQEKPEDWRPVLRTAASLIADDWQPSDDGTPRQRTEGPA